jgi:hypothetical protein
MRWLSDNRFRKVSRKGVGSSLSALAVELANLDQPSFRSNPNWGGLPSPSNSRLAAEADFRIAEIGEQWELVNQELTASVAKSAGRYRRRSEILIGCESEQEQHTLAYEELIQNDSVSYDSHRRFERKSNSSNLAHFGILIAFAIGEIPLNLLSLKALGSVGNNTFVLWGAAGSIGLAILASAHFAGVYSKRLATDRIELGDTNRSGAPKWARVVICLALVGVGNWAMWQLGSLRSQELTNAQVSEVITARLNLKAVTPTNENEDDPDAVGATEEAEGDLQDAVLILCEPTKVKTEADTFCSPSSEIQLKRKKDPFGPVRWALLAVQAAMYAIAFGIAFQSHDEILQQVKGQSEHLWWSKRKAKFARLRHKRAEIEFFAAVESRKTGFATFVERANAVVSDYEVAHWEYLRVVQGDRATPEGSVVEPVGVRFPNWVRTDYETSPFGIGARDPILQGLTLRHPENRFNAGLLRSSGSPFPTTPPSPTVNTFDDPAVAFEDLRYGPDNDSSVKSDRSVIPRVYPRRKRGPSDDSI